MTTSARDDFRRQALRCTECGFEVDARVFVEARRIRRRDDGQDMRVDVATEARGE